MIAAVAAYRRSCLASLTMSIPAHACRVLGGALAAASLSLLSTATVAAGSVSAARTIEATSPGPVVAIGGALRDGNAAVWERFVALAGGPGARIAVLPTASDDPRGAAESTVATLRRYGAEAFALPVAPQWPGSDAATAARDPQLVAQLSSATGVFFTGGAQARIVDTLAPGGRSTPLLDAIRSLHRRGGTIAGTSAGAAMLSGRMIRDAEDVISVLRGRLREGHEIGPGLGFAGSSLLVDQHFLARGRLGRLLPVMAAHGPTLGLGVDEDTAAILRDDEVEVLGAGAVVFVELDDAAALRAGEPFALRGARLSLLADGDRLDLRTSIVTPSAQKRAGQVIDPAAADFKPYYARAPFLLDVLGVDAVRTAMTRLLDSASQELRGLAFDPESDPQDPLAQLGFEFRFYKAGGTRGWYSSDGDGEPYTIVGLRLDVQPVRVARPLYGAWTR